MSSELMKISENEAIGLSPETIRAYICPKATDQEILFFYELCRSQNLNPFLKEAYLIKYGDNPAQQVVAWDVILREVHKITGFQGISAGVILLNKNGEIVKTDGIVIPNHQLIGGWASIKIEGVEDTKAEVNLSEYDTGKALWKDKPATMIIKTAIVHAARRAAPERLGNLYIEDEMGNPASKNWIGRKTIVEEEIQIAEIPKTLDYYINLVKSIKTISPNEFKEQMVPIVSEAKQNISDIEVEKLIKHGQSIFKDLVNSVSEKNDGIGNE